MDKNSSEKNLEVKDNIKDLEREIYFLRKIEKLISALYKITELMPDEEPLKWKMRSEGLNLLSSAMSFIDHRFETSEKDLAGVIHGASRLISLLEVSFIGSFVSQMNFTILKDEFESLRESIGHYKSLKSEPLPLVVEHHEITGPSAYSSEVHKGQSFIKDTYKGQQFSFDTPAGNSGDYIFKVGHLTNKRQRLAASGSTSVKNDPGARREHKRSSEEKQKRRDLILAFIREKKGEVSIKDILDNLGLKKSKTTKQKVQSFTEEDILKESKSILKEDYGLDIDEKVLKEMGEE